MKFIPEDKIPIENTPRMKGIKCKLFAYSIFSGLTLLPLAIALYIWYEYNWIIAIGVGLFLYLVSAIITSKLRLASIPADQRERNLSSLDIAKWYVKYHLCY